MRRLNHLERFFNFPLQFVILIKIVWGLDDNFMSGRASGDFLAFDGEAVQKFKLIEVLKHYIYLRLLFEQNTQDLELRKVQQLFDSVFKLREIIDCCTYIFEVDIAQIDVRDIW